MASSFKIGSSKTGMFDEIYVNNSVSNTWRATNRDAIRPLISDFTIDQYPPGLVGTMLGKGGMSLNIDQRGDMCLGGLGQIVTAIESESLPLWWWLQGGLDFQKRALTDEEFNAFLPFQGYPIEFSCSVYTKNDPTAGDAIVRWDERETVPPFRSVIRIRAWIGNLLDIQEEIPLTDEDGVVLRWPEELRGDITTVDQGVPAGDALLDMVPPFAEVRLSTPHPQIQGLPAAFYPRLYLLAPGRDNTFLVNAATPPLVLTGPGRIDSDGSMQPDMWPVLAVPTIPLFVPIPVRDAPIYHQATRMTILSSEIQPELVDLVSQLTVQRPRHVLSVSVPDRSAAGLHSTPQSFSRALYPHYTIDGRGFYIVDMIETDDEEVILTLSTERRA